MVKHRQQFLLAFSFLWCLSLTSSLVAQVQTDFDGDGISDILYTSSSSGLLWKSRPSKEGGEAINESFGQGTDYACPAHWLSPNLTSLAFVRVSPSNELLWKVSLGDGLQTSVPFGKGGNVALCGGDFDGDGIADAALVQVRGKKITWKVKLYTFSDSPLERRFRFGIAGDRAFFFNPDGTRDRATVFGRRSKKRAQMRLFDVITHKKMTIRGFPRELVHGERPRPFPVRQENGSDLIGITTDDGTDSTKIRVYDLTGSQVISRELSGLGRVFVGDFVEDEPGEEIGFQSSGRITFINPVSSTIKSTSVVSGTPVDEINIINTSAPTPTATPTASS